MTARDDDELAERVANLEDALRELQGDLQEEQSGVPHPPRPSELLRLTDQHAIPIAIAFLEAHIHALKLLQGVIRAAGVSDSTTRANGQVERVSRAAANRLDAIVSDLRSTPLPDNDEARELLDQAQSLRDELEERTETAQDVTDESATSDIGIDVDEELDAIRSDVRGSEEDDNDEDQSSGSNR